MSLCFVKYSKEAIVHPDSSHVTRGLDVAPEDGLNVKVDDADVRRGNQPCGAALSQTEHSKKVRDSLLISHSTEIGRLCTLAHISLAERFEYIGSHFTGWRCTCTSLDRKHTIFQSYLKHKEINSVTMSSNLLLSAIYRGK